MNVVSFLSYDQNMILIFYSTTCLISHINCFCVVCWDRNIINKSEPVRACRGKVDDEDAAIDNADTNQKLQNWCWTSNWFLLSDRGSYVPSFLVLLSNFVSIFDSSIFLFCVGSVNGFGYLSGYIWLSIFQDIWGYIWEGSNVRPLS